MTVTVLPVIRNIYTGKIWIVYSFGESKTDVFQDWEKQCIIVKK